MNHQMYKPLIMGLDPGTTRAYALLDTEGRLIILESSKQFTGSNLVEKVLSMGKVVIVSTDVNPAPSSVVNFTKKIGAKLFYPDKSLQRSFKRELTSKFKVKNKHERDALASAIFAYKKTKPLLNKIEISLKKNNKEYLSEEIKKVIILNNINIKDSIKKVETYASTSNSQ